MADTTGSRTINGQMVPVLKQRAFMPGNAIGPIYKSNGSPYPATVPGGISGRGPYSVADGSGSDQAGVAAASPFSFLTSPVPMLLLALILSAFALRYIHFA